MPQARHLYTRRSALHRRAKRTAITGTAGAPHLPGCFTCQECHAHVDAACFTHKLVDKLAMHARSLEEKAKVAAEELPSGGGAAVIAATGSTHTVRDTPSQAGLLLLSSQPKSCPARHTMASMQARRRQHGFFAASSELQFPENLALHLLPAAGAMHHLGILMTRRATSSCHLREYRQAWRRCFAAHRAAERAWTARL